MFIKIQNTQINLTGLVAYSIETYESKEIGSERTLISIYLKGGHKLDFRYTSLEEAQSVYDEIIYMNTLLIANVKVCQD